MFLMSDKKLTESRYVYIFKNLSDVFLQQNKEVFFEDFSVKIPVLRKRKFT